MATSKGRSSATEPAEGDGQPARGAVLIVAAVLVGFALLVYGFPEGGETAGPRDDATPSPAEDPADDEPGDPDDPTAPADPEDRPARSPEEVTVLVANGSGVPGAAGGLTDTLNADGYVTAEPANADSSDYETTVVFFVGEERPEAVAVAGTLGLDPAAVEPMPEPPPTSDGDLRNATILVVLGTDQAG